MSELIWAFIALIVGAVIGAAVAFTRTRRRDEAAHKLATEEAARVRDAAKAEGESHKKAALAKAKETAFKLKSEAEEEIRARRTELAKKEEGVAAREEQVDRRGKDVARREEEANRREKQVGTREQNAAAATEKAEKDLAAAKTRLENVAGMTAEEARRALEEQMLQEARKAAAGELRKIEAAATEEAAEKAKKIIATAVQRFAGEYVAERTVSVVTLPSDDLKGRLIGREGRNVRALEAATGTDLIIDDTPETITVSCFNPIRREIARLAIGRLVADGRIHPTRIEEAVQKSEKEVDAGCKEAGEQAVFDLGLSRVHPELVRALGSLKHRQTYAQNLLQHSIEVGFIAGAIAAELGTSVKHARRAGLLHDIGKSVDHEHEGSHALSGAQLCKKYGESPRVCQAIATHHGDAAQEGILDHIVDAANRLSVQRPGARREALEGFVTRLGDLEKIARTYPGVEKAYALQAGRELRVIVESAETNDDQVALLARDIAKKIEIEGSYAGQVRVAVIRETRATDYAR